MKFRDLSPLRYPGGKAKLTSYLSRLLAAQPTRPRHYAEPFAGGAGAALKLLVSEEVRTIHLNDLSPGIAAFWRSVFSETTRFAARIESQTASMDSWHWARETYDSLASDDFDRGFATFLLNRFNRSGIIEAGPIGGFAQAGAWGVGARFNALQLAERVRYIGTYRNRVKLTQLDGREFVSSLSEGSAAETLLYVDPPYLVQGERLYLNSLTYSDHRDLAESLRLSSLPWLLTYDADERITSDLYAGLRCAEFDITHTAQKHNVGTEYAIFSRGLVVPDIDLIPGRASRWVTLAAG